MNHTQNRSFCSPLGLARQIPVPNARMDALPLASVLLITLLMALAGARFIYEPGIAIALDDDANATGADKTSLTAAASAGNAANTGTADSNAGNALGIAATAPSTFALPRSSSAALPGMPGGASLVLTTRADLAFFNGRRYRMDGRELRDALRTAALESPVLLLKLDKAVTIDRLVLLLDAARDAGFLHVNLAAEDARSGGTR